ncbi:hypothetical protein BJP39_12145 [Streptomyces sp. CC77]|nr:hypothetical protein BJP39_12145 [Streptomyces sp. CC77]
MVPLRAITSASSCCWWGVGARGRSTPSLSESACTSASSLAWSRSSSAATSLTQAVVAFSRASRLRAISARLAWWAARRKALSVGSPPSRSAAAGAVAMQVTARAASVVAARRERCVCITVSSSIHGGRQYGPRVTRGHRTIRTRPPRVRHPP